MAFLANPNYPGPGAPQGLNWWDQNRFMMSGLPQAQPAAPQAPPLAPTLTPQDTQAQQAVRQLTSNGGADSGGGGRDGGTGFGIGNQEVDPSRAYAGRGLLGDPQSWGNTLGWAGMGAGLLAGPAGLALGPVGNAIGTTIDTNRGNRDLHSTFTPGSVDWGRAFMSNTLPGMLGLGRSAIDQVADRNAAHFSDLATRGDADLASMGAPQRAGLEADVGRTIAANPNIFGEAAPVAAPAPAAAPGPWNDIFGGAGNFGPGTPAGPPSAAGVWNDLFGGAGNFGNGAQQAGDPFDAYAKGGMVRPPSGGINPPGPDDQLAGLQTGEGVLTKAAMKRHPGLLEALNRGDVKKARGLLG